MKPMPGPYERMIFVCANKRGPFERVSCAGEGKCGLELLEKLKLAVKEKGLTQRIRVTKSGCQEICEKGPNAVVMPENIVLSALSVEDADDIIETWFPRP